MKFRVALLAASILGAPTAVLAQPVTGPYVSLGAGLDYVLDQNFRGGSQAYTNGRDKLSNNVGGIASGAIGYGLGNGLRIELQGDWSATRVDVGESTTSNYQQQYHGFVNAIYDFDGAMIGVPALNPYIGVGGGYGQSHFSNLNFASTDAGGTPTLTHTTGTYGDFAVQAIAGVAFMIDAVPGLALTAEYRFTTTPTNSSYEAQYLDGSNSHGVKLKTDGQYNNAALIGVRYALFAAPPPPPPAPPPAAAVPTPPEVAKTYLVFFDWDRADLTARARQIVAQAAAASTSTQTTRIEVNGYTDLSGTAAYNQRLSVRRAESVESELVRDGVNRSEISIHGFGETHPLVETAKGVREPQNRRVEIILH
jgi:outer membrane protein OmpA-like peptidoglycan-associated protein